jgi:hypothetical protein
MCRNNLNVNYTRLPVTNVASSDRKKLPTTSLNKKNIIISYRYFNCISSKNRNFNNCFSGMYDYSIWITFFLKRITEFSTMSISELINASTSTRFHPVENKHLKKLKYVICNTGLKVDELFAQDESQNYYELSFGTGNGRIFGYLIENIYYVLLLDPNHLIYKNASKGGQQDLLHKRYDPWNELVVDNLRR